MGKVVEAPAWADSNVWLCCSSSLMLIFGRKKKEKVRKEERLSRGAW